MYLDGTTKIVYPDGSHETKHQTQMNAFIRLTSKQGLMAVAEIVIFLLMSSW